MRVEDKILFNEIKKGNKVVYESLFSDYYENLIRFAESYVFDRQVSEDLVQELFIHIWEQAPRLEIKTSIKSYFYYSIRNTCLNYLKSQKVKDKHELLYIDALMNSDDDVEIYDSEIFLKVSNALEELPPQMAKIFQLKLLENLKQDEIAEHLDISVNTVKTQLKRARVKLREILLKRTSLTFFL